MKNIPTANDFFLRKPNGSADIEYWAIEFAKLHVKAALEAANTNVRLVGRPLNNPHLECTYDVESVTEFNDNTDDYMFTVDSDTILNAYPLENIK